jgi:hypothetical protein
MMVVDVCHNATMHTVREASVLCQLRGPVADAAACRVTHHGDKVKASGASTCCWLTVLLLLLLLLLLPAG